MVRSAKLFLSLLSMMSYTSAMMVNNMPTTVSKVPNQSTFGGNGITQCALPTPLRQMNTHTALIAAIDNREDEAIVDHFDSWVLRFFNAEGRSQQLEVALNHAVTLPSTHSGTIVAFLLTKVQRCSVEHDEHLLHNALNNGHASVIEYMKTANPSLLLATFIDTIKDGNKARWFDILNDAMVLTKEQKNELIFSVAVDAARSLKFKTDLDKSLYLRARYQHSLERIRTQERTEFARLSMDDSQELSSLPCHAADYRDFIGLGIAGCPLILAPCMKFLDCLDPKKEHAEHTIAHHKED